jgi:hypothetical protein
MTSLQGLNPYVLGNGTEANCVEAIAENKSTWQNSELGSYSIR